jgi:hypothetical protein
MKDMIKYCIAFFAVLAGFYYGSFIIFDENTYQSQTLEEVWHKDIKKLEAEKALPPGLKNLRNIDWETPDITAKTWKRFVQSPFLTKESGEYRLELLVLTQNDAGSTLTAVIQHHLIHVASGNSVWELGRTYALSK